VQSWYRSSTHARRKFHGSDLDGTGTGPHQARVVAGATIGYDANGNMSNRNGWTYTWNADNTLASLGNGSYTENYTYDADGDRLMLIGWHGQHLDHAVGELNQVTRIIRQPEVLFDGPEALQRCEIDRRSVLLPHQLQRCSAKIYGHAFLLALICL
jgi:hypothetical protein